MARKFFLIITLALIPLMISNAYAHTVDSAGPYRLEIGWINEPPVSQETNGLTLAISEFDPAIPPDKQPFDPEKGVEGLEKELKLELVYKTEKIILKLIPDHNAPGKYFTLIDPTVPGYYQLNVVGKIGETVVSKSMHPPKVEDRTYIEFPEPEDITLQQIIDAHTAIVEDINKMKGSTKLLEEPNLLISIGHVGFGVGIAGVIIALIAIRKIKKVTELHSL